MNATATCGAYGGRATLAECPAPNVREGAVVEPDALSPRTVLHRLDDHILALRQIRLDLADARRRLEAL
jgi:hypothetical protein